MTDETYWSEDRGPKMSAATGRVIWKYPVPVLEEFTLNLPREAEVLRIAMIDGHVWLWALVDTEAELVTRRFFAVKCGAAVPDGPELRHLGFYALYVQQELGLYVFEEVTNG